MIHGHGDDLYATGNEIQYNFSSNVWYGAPYETLREHLYTHFPRLTHYPDPDAGEIARRLAKLLGLHDEEILVTNGSITAFYLIAQTWPHSTSAIPFPTFSEYEDACCRYNHRLIRTPSQSPWPTATKHRIDCCWICNPNNPDGTWLHRSVLINLLEQHPSTRFIIDQTYADFVDDAPLEPDLIRQYHHLILIRSISKSCNIPGLRIGYIIAHPEIIQSIRQYIIPWSVNSFAQEATQYILNHPDQFRLPLSAWLEETHWLMQQLSDMPQLEVIPSATTFFLVRLRKGDASALKHYLLTRHAILIRDASNFRGLDRHYFRLSTQSHEANLHLLDALHDWFTNALR